MFWLVCEHCCCILQIYIHMPTITMHLNGCEAVFITLISTHTITLIPPHSITLISTHTITLIPSHTPAASQHEEASWQWCQELTRDMVYSLLPIATRQQLHRAIAETLDACIHTSGGGNDAVSGGGGGGNDGVVGGSSNAVGDGDGVVTTMHTTTGVDTYLGAAYHWVQACRGNAAATWGQLCQVWCVTHASTQPPTHQRWWWWYMYIITHTHKSTLHASHMGKKSEYPIPITTHRLWMRVKQQHGHASHPTTHSMHSMLSGCLQTQRSFPSWQK